MTEVERAVSEEFDDFLANTKLSELMQSHVVGLYQLVLSQLRNIDRFFITPTRQADSLITVNRDDLTALLHAIDDSICCLNSDRRSERAEELKYAAAKLMKGHMSSANPTPLHCSVDMTSIERKIAALSALQPGWYGDGVENSQSISQAALLTARAIACVMIAGGQSPLLFPRTGGGVTVESTVTDVYIEADGTVSSVVTV